MLAVDVGPTRAWNAQPLRPLGESAEMLDLMVVEEDGAAYFFSLMAAVCTGSLYPSNRALNFRTA
jgi:hypothetical protein